MAKAIIDIGTNTFNLLVFEKDLSGTLHTLKIIHETELPVFLGKGGIEKGFITADAFERGMEALRTHRSTALSFGAEAITGIGTSALRNASNAEAFIQAAAAIDIPITVIPGDEEAGLILDGVRRSIPMGARPALIMDIGGGSIEFILATEKALMWKRSFELGVTRLRERIPVRDPITLEEELRIAEHLDAQLEPLWSVVERHEPHLLIGSAGSFDSIAAMLEVVNDQEPKHYSAFFEADLFLALKDRIIRMGRTERAAMPGLSAHRVDTITYALIAIERVLIAGGIRDMAWSRYSLKEGAASRMLHSAQ